MLITAEILSLTALSHRALRLLRGHVGESLRRMLASAIAFNGAAFAQDEAPAAPANQSDCEAAGGSWNADNSSCEAAQQE